MFLTLILILSYVYLEIIVFKWCLPCCNCWTDVIIVNSDLESKLETLLPKSFTSHLCNQCYQVYRNNQCSSAKLVYIMHLYFLRDIQSPAAAVSSSNILPLIISICCACRALCAHFLSSCWRCIKWPWVLSCSEWGLSNAKHNLLRIQGVICDLAIHRHRSVYCRHCFSWHGC